MSPIWFIKQLKVFAKSNTFIMILIISRGLLFNTFELVLKSSVMKKLFLISIFLLFSISTYSQKTPLPKTEKNGDLTEITIYYENGSIMQHGFYTIDGKLHNSWESYNLDGSKKCFANYNNGIKVGVWTYWNDNKITKIEYDKNKVLKIEEIVLEEGSKNNF